MKSLFKFSPAQTHNFRNTNHFQIFNDESGSVVQLVSGSYKSFTDSFDFKTLYDASSFPKVLNQACEDFRAKYKINHHKEFTKNNKQIINQFIQLNLTSEGTMSAFNHGGAQIGFLRSGKSHIVSSENLQCKQGDILYVNIEANPSFDPHSLLVALSQKNNTSLESYHFPVFYIIVEEETFASVQKPQKPAKQQIPHDEKNNLNSKTVSSVSPDKEPKSNAPLWKWMLLLGSLVVLSMGAWWGLNNQLINSNTSTVTSDSLSTFSEDSSETMTEESSSTPILTDFPQTDSLLTIYYQSTPRTLEALDEVLYVFNGEQANNPQIAQTKWEELKEERKTLLLALLEPLDVILNSAENAYRERNKDEYQNLIEKADKFFNEAISTKWQDVPIVKERIERLNRIKSYNNEPDINS